MVVILTKVFLKNISDIFASEKDMYYNVAEEEDALSYPEMGWQCLRLRTTHEILTIKLDGRVKTQVKERNFSRIVEWCNFCAWISISGDVEAKHPRSVVLTYVGRNDSTQHQGNFLEMNFLLNPHRDSPDELGSCPLHNYLTIRYVIPNKSAMEFDDRNEKCCFRFRKTNQILNIFLFEQLE